MRLKNIHLRGFKRFSDTRIQDLPDTARLIVLAGPNGSGKSSIFDGLKTWHWTTGGASGSWDESYGTKVGSPTMSWPDHVSVNFHEPTPLDPTERKKLIYVRSAFRNEADFNIGSFSRMASPLDVNRISRLIDADASVSDNYQRLVMATIDGIYRSDIPDTATKKEIRERIIGKVQESMLKVFPDLMLEGVGGVVADDSAGTFYFSKGNAQNFLYKNLSAGEKAVFDLILDGVVKAEHFDNSVWCIDEPESHLNTKIQADLLEELVSLLPVSSQMVLATHSIGFMRRAWEMATRNPGSVVFLDMEGQEFDEPAVLVPTKPSREFWGRTLRVALDDLATLMAPEHIVLCEGRPPRSANDDKGKFDAGCYREIFGEKYPGVDFLSTGNSTDVSEDRLEVGKAIQTVTEGTKLTRLIDRDWMTNDEIANYRSRDVRVLSRRNIESYLFDDEVLIALCENLGKPELAPELLAIKKEETDFSVDRGNDSNDLKRATPQMYQRFRKALALWQAGSTYQVFARETLAPLMKEGMLVFGELENDIFGSSGTYIE